MKLRLSSSARGEPYRFDGSERVERAGESSGFGHDGVDGTEADE
jgi:hypothetical protein